MPSKKKKENEQPDYLLILPKHPLPLAKQYVTPEKCECGCRVRLNDTERSELLCPVCGLVHDTVGKLSKNNLIYGSWSTSELYTGNGYTPSEKEFMQKKGIKTRVKRGNKELNTLDYKYLLDSFKFDLCLSNTDIQDVLLILKKSKSMKNLHPRLNYERILLAVCRYVLYQKGITGYLVNLNSSIYREYNLTGKDYKIIEKNIEKYGAIYRCNT